jgi:hypothetical protein
MLCYRGYSLIENRSGLILQADLTQANGHAKRRVPIAIAPDQSGA